MRQVTNDWGSNTSTDRFKFLKGPEDRDDLRALFVVLFCFVLSLVGFLGTMWLC